MRCYLLLFAATILISSGCASSSDSASDRRIATLSQSSQKVWSDMDERLDQLEKDTNDVQNDYEIIESTVVSRVNIGTTGSSNEDSITAVLNGNNIIIINENALSKNEFVEFAEKNLPKRCAQPPRLAIEPGAAYDTAAFMLETFYAHGCTQVDIVEH